MVNTKIRLTKFGSQRWKSSIQSEKKDWVLTVAQIMNSLLTNSDLSCRKWGKPLPFKRDLNQIPFDYTVEVRNRFKGLDLIDRVPDELWIEVRDIVQKTGSKTIPRKRNAKRLSGEALQIAEKKKRRQKQRRKGKIYPFEYKVPKNSKER